MSEGIRINKYLSEAGVCSRPGADEYVLNGKVCINGTPAEMGQKVYEEDEVTVDGKPDIKREKRLFWHLINRWD